MPVTNNGCENWLQPAAPAMRPTVSGRRGGGVVEGASTPTDPQTPQNGAARQDGAAPETAGTTRRLPRAGLPRSLAVIGGLILSFSIIVLAGSEVLSLLHLHQYWPADYLIDAQGNVRSVHFGEGDYSTMGDLIRQLLQAAHPHLSVPTPVGVPDKTPAGELSPGTYLGYTELQYLDPPQVDRDNAATYHFPTALPLGALGLSGTCADHAQEATAGAGAQLELGFLAQDVYLVLGGTGTLDVSVSGQHTQTIKVGGTPRLYTLYQAGSPTSGKLLLRASPGVQAYDFTFG
jgi:hypothetical protein